MIAEIFLLILATLFLVISVFLFNGKGAWLIAGYNTASKEEQNKYDKKKICKATAFPCLISSIMLFITDYMGYKVDTGKISEKAMIPLALIIVVAIFASVIIAMIYANKKAKK